MRKEIECLYRITNPYTQDIRITNPNERRDEQDTNLVGNVSICNEYVVSLWSQ